MSDQEYLNTLLNALETAPEREKIADIREREIVAYMEAVDVTEGVNAIPLDIIYKKYAEWYTSRKPIPLVRFRQIFKKYHKEYKQHMTRYYRLEPESFDLPDFYTMYSDPHYSRRARRSKEPKYLGVFRFNSTKFYYAKLLLPTGKYLPLGNYKTAFEAAHTYDEAAIQVYGKDAVLNFPGKWRNVLNGKKDVPFVYRKYYNRLWYNRSIERATKEEQKYHQELLQAVSRKAKDTKA